MPGRRQFLIGCGCAVTAPALASIGLPLEMSQPQRLHPADASTQPETCALEELELRIAGWDSPGDANDAADGHVWIRINSSWQATWR